GAVGLLFEKVRTLNKIMEGLQGVPDQATWTTLLHEREQLYAAGSVLGFLRTEPDLFFEQISDAASNLTAEDIDVLVRERSEAREQKDWARADALRDRLKEEGIVIEDGPQGTTWRWDV
ncbi:MAG: cysteine--tRNA ligase, partial [Deltaproteobacteria bacterium]